MLIHWNLISGNSSLVEVQSESTINNDSGHPTGECNEIKYELKMPVDNLTSNNQLLEATKSEISTEKLTVENAHIVEKGSEIMKSEMSTEKITVENIVETGSEMINVDNPCEVGQSLKKAKVNDEFEPEKSLSNINQTNSAVVEQPHNQLQPDLFPAQPGQPKEQIGDVHQDKQNGSKEMEGKQQSRQEVGFIESISKRSRSESQNAEQISERKNMSKRMKSHGRA